MKLPEGWAIVTVEELAGPKGLVTDGDWVESKDQDVQGDVRLIQLADVGEGTFRDRSRRFMLSEVAAELRCTYLMPEDVLIARMPDPLGRACAFPGLDQPAVTAVDVMIWRTDGSLADANWFTNAINSPIMRSRMVEEASGTTRQRVAGGRIKKFEIPFPSMAEQRRIVAKLDALFARLARARAELDRVSSLARKQKQAALSKYLGAASISTERIAFANQIELLTSGSRDWSQYYDRGSSVFVLAGNVRPSRFDPTPKRYVDPPLDSADARRSRIEKDDLLLTIVGAGTGDICRVDTSVDNYFVCQSVARIKLRQPSLSSFYMHWFSSDEHGRKDFKAGMYGAARPHLSFEQINGFLVPSISTNSAKAAVLEVERAFAHIDRLEAEAARARALLDRLEAAMLTKAFKGELVPQDPNDEPASMLLERIRAKRAAAAPASKTKRGRRLSSVAG